MKIAALSFLLVSCYPVKDNWKPYNAAEKSQNLRKINCRITYYHPYQDRWGSQVACPKTKKAIEGITVAAHPDFKFGQTIFIPELKGVIGDGHFIVQDRGSAVTKKKAAKGAKYVFDIFVTNGSKMKKYARHNSEYMTVYIK